MEVVKQYSKFLILSYVIALVFLCLTALLFAYTNINDSLISTFVFVIIGITNLIGSMLVSRKLKRRGFFIGLVFGLIYFLIIYLLTAILYTGFFVNQAVGIYVLVSIVAGIIGGVVGVNVG